jgi:hypothetical protein
MNTVIPEIDLGLAGGPLAAGAVAVRIAAAQKADTKPPHPVNPNDERQL